MFVAVITVLLLIKLILFQLRTATFVIMVALLHYSTTLLLFQVLHVFPFESVTQRSRTLKC